MKSSDRWVKGFWPMIFMSFSTGMVYCWTLFREDIERWGTVPYYIDGARQYIDGVAAYFSYFTPFILTLCFMLALFFLGMTAAFGGFIVERSVKRAALYTFIFFSLGWLLTGIGVYFKSPVLTIIGFGPVQGIGLGLGYLTPIKTLMMWFEDRKGFAAGVAIGAFGLAGLIGNPLLGLLLSIDALADYPHRAFYILTGLFALLTFVAYLMIDRPPLKASDAAARTLTAAEVIFSKKFIFLWMVIFLNIAAGLALMSHEQQIYLMTGLYPVEDNRGLIVLLCTITAGGGNLLGRLIMASTQDKTNKKHLPYYVMSLASIAMCAIAASTLLPLHFVPMFIAIFIVQFFFGCGFACLPGVLDQQYGMKQLATIQGYMLTAWAIAALVGPQIAQAILTLADPVTGAPADPYTIYTLYLVLAGMFVVQLIFLLLFVKVSKKDKQQETEAAATV